MESSFSQRFKSSMKIGKNLSVFDRLIPIDKQIKLSQVHQDWKRKLPDDEGMEYELNYRLLFPPIGNSGSTKSSSRVVKERRNELRNSYAEYRAELVSKSISPGSGKRYGEYGMELKSKETSPGSWKYRIQVDALKLLKGVEKEDQIFVSRVQKNRITRKLRKAKDKLN